MLKIRTPPPPCHVSIVQLAPPPNATHIVPPEVGSTNSGMAFWQSDLRRNPNVSKNISEPLGTLLERFLWLMVFLLIDKSMMPM